MSEEGIPKEKIPKEELRLGYLIKTSHSVTTEFCKKMGQTDDETSRLMREHSRKITNLVTDGKANEAYEFIKGIVMTNNLESSISDLSQ